MAEKRVGVAEKVPEVSVRAWQRVVQSSWFWWAIVVGVVLIGAATLTVSYWDWLHGGDVSPSVTIHNIVLAVSGLVAVLIAVWRPSVFRRQAKTQAEETRMADHGLLDNRYQSGMEMLYGNNFARRVVGIHDLARLAAEQPDEMHMKVLTAFCNYVRNQSVDQGCDGAGTGADFPKNPIRDDVQAIMDAIGSRSNRQIQLEKDKKIKLNLRGANLHGCVLTGSNLKDAILGGADLSSVRFVDVKLSQVDLWCVDLTGAALIRVDFSNSNFCGVNVSSAKFHNVKGLTQGDLDQATAPPDHPPLIDGAEDPYTGEQVVWKGGYEWEQA